MILDAIAAFKLLAEFNLNGISSVLKAHFHFYRSLPDLHRKRKTLKMQQSTQPEGRKSVNIVWQFYVRKRKKYSELPRFRTL
jgi:hypothetical protein